MLSTYSIKDLEHLTGIKAHTIRIWEQRYKLIEPRRTDTNIRYYTAEDLKLMLNVSLLIKKGYRISKVAKMNQVEITQEVDGLSHSPRLHEDQIHGLTTAMVDIDEERFNKIISNSSLNIGFEKTVTEIIYPFLDRIGILWQTGSINPAQEHFITNLIRQKIVVAIDSLYSPSSRPSGTFLLFLPEGELHELSLLFAHYILKSRNFKVIYLGQNLPHHDLKMALDIHSPDYVFSINTSSIGLGDFEQYVKDLSNICSDSKILLSGFLTQTLKSDVPGNVTILDSIQALIDYLEPVSVDS